MIRANLGTGVVSVGYKSWAMAKLNRGSGVITNSLMGT